MKKEPELKPWACHFHDRDRCPNRVPCMINGLCDCRLRPHPDTRGSEEIATLREELKHKESRRKYWHLVSLLAYAGREAQDEAARRMKESGDWYEPKPTAPADGETTSPCVNYDKDKCGEGAPCVINAHCDCVRHLRVTAPAAEEDEREKLTRFVRGYNVMLERADGNYVSHAGHEAVVASLQRQLEEQKDYIAKIGGPIGKACAVLGLLECDASTTMEELIVKVEGFKATLHKAEAVVEAVRHPSRGHHDACAAGFSNAPCTCGWTKIEAALTAHDNEKQEPEEKHCLEEGS